MQTATADRGVTRHNRNCAKAQRKQLKEIQAIQLAGIRIKGRNARRQNQKLRARQNA